MDQPIPTTTRRLYTVEEYLDLEDRADERNEYRDGEILNMPGGTFAHERVINNVSFRLNERLTGTPCLVLGSNMKVRTDRTGFLYADLTATCDAPVFDPPDRQLALVNPQVIIEVLSPSTESADRGVKFNRYRAIPSLRDYILLHQDRPLAELFYRQPDGIWAIGGHVEGLDATLSVQSLAIEVPLSQVYADVTFPPPAVPAE